MKLSYSSSLFLPTVLSNLDRSKSSIVGETEYPDLEEHHAALLHQITTSVGPNCQIYPAQHMCEIEHARLRINNL